VREGESRRRDGGDDEKPKLEGPRRDFSKGGSAGKIGDATEKWLKGFFGSPPYDTAFPYGEDGKAIDISKIKGPCPGVYYVGYHTTKEFKGTCENADYKSVVEAAEQAALPEAEKIAQACENPPEGEGCEVQILIDYEMWLCGTKEDGTALIYVALTFKIVCFTL